MDKNDLKAIWNEANFPGKETGFVKMEIEDVLKMKHINIITKVLNDIRIKILLYILFLILFVGLMIYAFGYLGVHLSFRSLVPLFLVGLFLITQTTSETSRLSVLTKTTDNLSMKESLMFFRKKLDRIRTIDFISYLILLYLSAILIVIDYLKDIGGIHHLSWGNEILPLPILIFFVLILLLIPWFIKYQHNQRYKGIYSSLNDSVSFLNNEL